VAGVEELLKEARRLDVSSTEGRFRLGDLAEALDGELPAVADLTSRLAIDLEIDPDLIIQSWFVVSAFPPATRRPGLPWATYVSLRFHPARHDLAERAVPEHWDQSRLGRELAAWFSTHQHTQQEKSPWLCQAIGGCVVPGEGGPRRPDSCEGQGACGCVPSSNRRGELIPPESSPD
jgi:hypothetical protein